VKRRKRKYKWSIAKKGKKGRPYKSPRYLRFRRDVLERDGWKCQWPRCGKEIWDGTRLVVHHIKRWADYPKLRYTVDNGICLCWDCHQITIGKEQKYEKMLTKKVNNKK